MADTRIRETARQNTQSAIRVRAPTLLIVGGLDKPVIELNHRAQDRLKCKTELVIVPGASHLFEEPGTLDAVVQHATRWFHAHLPGAAAEA